MGYMVRMRGTTENWVCGLADKFNALWLYCECEILEGFLNGKQQTKKQNH